MTSVVLAICKDTAIRSVLTFICLNRVIVFVNVISDTYYATAVFGVTLSTSDRKVKKDLLLRIFSLHSLIERTRV